MVSTHSCRGLPIVINDQGHLDNVMKAVLLAAGEGTRLRLLTENKPKALIEVNGDPILTYCFD
jgi:glucose-1-phosphate thymidylyltransferase